MERAWREDKTGDFRDQGQSPHLFLLTPFSREVIFPFRSAPAVGAFIGFPPFFFPIAGGWAGK
jgi:hypothetical protein